MNRFILFFVLLLLSNRIAFAQLSGGLPPLTPNRTSSLPEITIVKIGHVGPISGVIGHLGIDNERGAKMAIDELNSSGTKIGGKAVKFELVTEDDAADPRQAVSAAQRIVGARVSGVIGHLNSGSTIPASYIYNTAGIPQISPSATNPKFTRQGIPGAFRVIADDVQLGRTLGKFTVEILKGKNIAVIDDRTAYGQGVAEEFEKAVKAAGGNIISHEFTSDRASDFFAILTTLKAKNPDVLFFGGMDTVAGPMLKQMKRLGLTAKFIGGDGICTAELVQLAADGMSDENVFCAEAGGVEGYNRIGMEKFRAEYRAKFNSDVQVYAPYVYDAVKVMVGAMVKAGSSDPAKYLPALKVTNYQGVTGPITFDEKGDIKNGSFTLYTYTAGMRVTLGVIR